MNEEIHLKDFFKIEILLELSIFFSMMDKLGSDLKKTQKIEFELIFTLLLLALTEKKKLHFFDLKTRNGPHFSQKNVFIWPTFIYFDF